MRVAVEAVLGKLKDKEVPSRSLLASKLEQIESNQPIVENLQEVASLEDSELETYSAVIDPATNVLKVKPGKTLTSLPQTPEELRLRHRRIGLSWDFLATKHSSRVWLSKNLTDTLRRFSDYVLGPQVAGLVTGDGRKPTWSLILQFEHEARKAAYKWLRDGEVTTLDAALPKRACPTELYIADLGWVGWGHQWWVSLHMFASATKTKQFDLNLRMFTKPFQFLRCFSFTEMSDAVLPAPSQVSSGWNFQLCRGRFASSGSVLDTCHGLAFVSC